MAHHATDVHQWLSSTCALLDEDTPLWVSPEDDLAGGGLLVGLNGDTYYMPPDTARKLDDTMSEQNISGQALLEKIWSNVMRWLEENSVDDPPVSPGS